MQTSKTKSNKQIEAMQHATRTERDVLQVLLIFHDIAGPETEHDCLSRSTLGT